MARTSVLVCALFGLLVRPSTQETATQALTRAVRDVVAPAVSGEQPPCSLGASCVGAPCVTPPCPVPNLPAGVDDQTAAAAALSHSTLEGHSAALEALSAGEREARNSAEQRAREVHAAQVAAEESRRSADVANAQNAAVATASVEQAAEYRNNLDEVASQAAEEASAEEAARFVAQVAASEGQDVMEAVRSREAVIAQRAMNSAAEAATESFVSGTATYVGRAVHAGAIRVVADDASSRSDDSGAVAQVFALQSDIDASSVDAARARHEDLEREAQASEAHAAELQSQAAALAAREREAQNSARRMEREAAAAREEAIESGARAAENLRLETERALRSIQRTAAAGSESLESVRDEVSQEHGILSVRPHRTVADLLLDDGSATAISLPEGALPVEVLSDPACIPCVELPPCMAYIECP